MPTRPKLPEDLAPLSSEGVRRLLAGMGEDMVLVGGQALAYWMARYGLLIEDELVSYDGDALGPLGAARALASTLNARLLVPEPNARTALVAQLRIPTPDGKPANVDILHQLYTVGGLTKSAVFTRRVIRDSVRVEWREGSFIRVMEPFDLLESRVQNAAGLLEQKGPHVVTQAAWAVAVARVALLRLAGGDTSVAAKRLGQKLQGIYTLAHSQPGRSVLRDHGIEILDAVDLPALRQLAPEHGPQIERIEAALLRRRLSP